MQPHVKNYYKAFGYDQGDFIACELCGTKAVEIHHLEPRSKFGSKFRIEQDQVSNLVALCRKCHEEAHGTLSRIHKISFERIIKNRQVKTLKQQKHL